MKETLEGKWGNGEEGRESEGESEVLKIYIQEREREREMLR